MEIYFDSFTITGQFSRRKESPDPRRASNADTCVRSRYSSPGRVLENDKDTGSSLSWSRTGERIWVPGSSPATSWGFHGSLRLQEPEHRRMIILGSWSWGSESKHHSSPTCWCYQLEQISKSWLCSRCFALNRIQLSHMDPVKMFHRYALVHCQATSFSATRRQMFMVDYDAGGDSHS